MAFWSATSDVICDAVVAGPAGRAVLEQINESVAVSMRLMDQDNDGLIVPAEYGLWLTAHNLHADAAKLLQLMGFTDGRATIAQVQYAMLDFILSNNPQAPGNSFIGPLG